jgi:hypothetical protein
VANACNSSNSRGDHKFKASLGYKNEGEGLKITKILRGFNSHRSPIIPKSVAIKTKNALDLGPLSTKAYLLFKGLICLEQIKTQGKGPRKAICRVVLGYKAERRNCFEEFQLEQHYQFTPMSLSKYRRDGHYYIQ